MQKKYSILIGLLTFCVNLYRCGQVFCQSSGEINILDIVVLVNIILDASLNPEYADLNNDGEINVIDVVILVNQILGN